MPPLLITPSILSADLAHLQDEVESIAPYADWLQVDVMDGHFVPNLSFGAPVLKCLKTDLPLDIHLMVENPADRIEEFLSIGVSHITFHAEVVDEEECRRLVEAIRKGGATAGVAVNPETDYAQAERLLLGGGGVDLFLVMSVHPGFGGQDFIPEVLSKVRLARETFPDLMIQMDGGIDDQTAPGCIEAGANNLVSGSYIFGAADRGAAIEALRGVKDRA